MGIASTAYIRATRSIRRIPAACLCVFLFAGCGSEFTALLDRNPYLAPLAVTRALETATATVFWSEQGGTIKKIKTNGTAETTIFTATFMGITGTPLDIALDMTGQKLYMAIEWNGYYGMSFTNFDGTTWGGWDLFPDPRRVSEYHGPTEIAVDGEASIVYWNEHQFASSHNDIWRLPLSETAPVKWVNALSYLYTYCIALDASHRKIYISADSYWDISAPAGSGQGGGIYIADMDSANSKSLQFEAAGPVSPSVPLRDIAVDPSGGNVYYVSDTGADPVIMRAGLSFEEAVPWITADGFDIQKLALDARGRKIYWTSYAPAAIYRADMDEPESGVQRFRLLSGRPTGIAITH